MPSAATQNRRVDLRPLTPADYEFAYQTLVDPAAGGRLARYGGGVPSRDQVIATMWDQVLAQFVVVGRQTGHRHGLVIVTSPDFRNRFAYISIVGSPTRRTGRVALEGGLLAIDYAFATWDLRKVYAEVISSNAGQFGRIDKYASLEARYAAHVFVDGAYRDVLVFALYRDRWMSEVSPRLGILRARPT